MVEYKERLKWCMDHGPKAPVTVRQLATRLGLSYQGVRKVCIGESHAFSTANHEDAASFLGVSSRWLATGKGPRLAGPDSAGPGVRDVAPNDLKPRFVHEDVWIAEAIKTLESMSPEDRRAAVLNLRVFVATLHPHSGGQALPVAA